MRKNLLNEIDQMKYLFGYKPGKVISEQTNKPDQDLEKEYEQGVLELLDQGFTKEEAEALTEKRLGFNPYTSIPAKEKDLEKVTQKKYNEIFKRTRKDASIGGYLDMCKFYPVTHPSIAATVDNPEEAKVRSFEEFKHYCSALNKGMQIGRAHV